MTPLVTVCVLTYNPDWVKFRNTLRSIICQKSVDFDIVVADDGSKDDCFDKAELYFKEYYFSSYQFVKNTKNQGIVKNVISALQHTRGKYVKLISPGDLLYGENVLAEFVDFAEHNPAAAYFGNAVYYSLEGKKGVKIYPDLHNPRDYYPWITDDYRTIRRNYLYENDYILGASFLCRRDILGEYLHRMADIVIYTEDFSIVWMIAAHQKVKFVDRLFIFYEYGLGISNNANPVWKERIINDNMKGFELIFKNKDMSKLELMIYKSKSNIVKLFYRLLVEPMYFIHKFRKRQIESRIGDTEDSKNQLQQLLNND